MSKYTQSDQPTNPLPKQPTDTAIADLDIPDLAIALPLPVNIVISLAALPLLAALISGQIAARTLTQLGSNSEEFFRGSRLPTLPLLTALAELTTLAELE